MHVNMGLLFKNTGRTEDAARANEKALAIKEKLAAEFPTIPSYLSDFGAALSNHAMLLRDQNKYSAALRIRRKAIQQQQAALRTEPKNPRYRDFLVKHFLTLASILLESGESSAAGQAVNDGLAVRPTSGDDAVIAAIMAAASGRRAAEMADLSDGERAARIAACHDLAMKMLHEAVRRGFRDAKRLQNDPELEPLRTREDFQNLISQMTAGNK